MGYYAYGNGSALLKNNVNKEELFKKLDKKVDDAYCLEYEYDDKETINITDFENYSEEDIMEFLNILSPCITEGSIEYSGGMMITIGNLFLIRKQKNGMKLKEKYIIHDEFSNEVLIEDYKIADENRISER